MTVVDRSADALRRLSAQFGSQVRTIFSTRDAIAQLVRRADLLIGAVLVPGAAAPKLITRDMVKTMKPGAVIVDIAIDQGGCSETSRPTTHSDPTYVEEGVVHYCVTNMPGSVARTSTFALNNVTLPFTLMLADKGWQQALRDDPHLRAGLNVHEGKVYLRAGRRGARTCHEPDRGCAQGLVAWSHFLRRTGAHFAETARADSPAQLHQP